MCCLAPAAPSFTCTVSARLNLVPQTCFVMSIKQTGMSGELLTSVAVRCLHTQPQRACHKGGCLSCCLGHAALSNKSILTSKG